MKTFCVILIVACFGLLEVKAQGISINQMDLNKLALEQAPEAPLYKTAALAIPERLNKEGVQFVGNVDLKKVRQSINGITFRENTSFVPTVVGTRASAMYDPKTKTLVLNTSIAPILAYAVYDKTGDLKSFLSERAEPFILHESLGAAGVNDKKYDTSLGAYFLATPSQKLSPSQNKSLNSKLQKHLESTGGGTTTVGGGGNALSLWIKLKLMDESLSIPGQMADSFRLFFFILDANIEGDLNCRHGQLMYDKIKNEIKHCESSDWYDFNNLDGQTQEIHRFLGSL